MSGSPGIGLPGFDMQLDNFFRSSWLIQLLVGIGLFAVSLYMEARLLERFLPEAVVAISLAVILEVGKVMAVVWNRYMVSVASVYPLSIRGVSALFRIGLLLLSVLCSLLYMAAYLDRPMLEQVRAADLAEIDGWQKRELARLEREQKEKLARLRKEAEVSYALRLADRKKRIDELEQALAREMDNVVKGVFKGPRYREFERLLRKERSALEAATSVHLKELRSLEAKIVAGVEQRRERIIAMSEERRRQVLASDYLDDERVHHPTIVAFQKVIEQVFGGSLEHLQFVFMFSLLISFLIETGIVLAFETVTAVWVPAFQAQHETELETRILETRIDGASRREQKKHESAVEEIERIADRTAAAAESMYGSIRR